MILSDHQRELTKFVPANQQELERLEVMLNYLNTHFESVISLQELADQIHMSREVCCRLFKKMTGKTITGYLEEYRADKSLPLVQSGQYSMTQIAEMVGFSNPSRFASAFRKDSGVIQKYTIRDRRLNHHPLKINHSGLCNEILYRERFSVFCIP